MVESLPPPQAIASNASKFQRDYKYPTVRHVPEEFQADFADMLEGFGFSADPPSPKQIQRGIHKAKKIVDSGSTTEFLKEQPFVDGESIKSQIEGINTGIIRFGTPMYVDPSLIVSAEGFDDWQGRARTTKAYLNREGVAKNVSSLEVIEDYATRDTQLPLIDFGLNLQITEDGVQISAQNAHRVAAAKLRGEPLAFREISIYDQRHNAQ